MQIDSLIYNVAILFVMMVPGVILKLCHLVPDGFGKGLSNLILYVAQPVLVLAAYINCTAKFSEIWQNILVVFILSIVAHAIFSAVALLLFKGAPDARRRMLRFATVFGNAAFMGIPLIEVLISSEAAIYASIYNITFNLFLWTLGVHFCTYKDGTDVDQDGDSDAADAVISMGKNTRAASSLLKVLLHPITIASVLGVICLALGVNSAHLTSWNLTLLVDCIGMIKALVAPLSMVIIGLRLAEIDFLGALKDGYMYIFLLARHIVLPIAVLGVIKLAGLLFPISDVATLVTVILAATPAASSATMFAEMYDCDAVYTSRLVAISTVLCIITMPLVVSLALI